MSRVDNFQSRALSVFVPLFLIAGAALAAGACTTDPDPPDLSSLKRSSEATFVCISHDGEGVPLDFCPQGARNARDLRQTTGIFGYELHSLVTQTLSAEVAVIRVSGVESDGDSAAKVLDVDPSNPGVTPLRVGGHPTDITTTPGGLASFVGVGEVGREGIFALPTSCLFVPGEDEPARDLTSWPACSLSSAPGDMIILVDKEVEDGDPRKWCSDPPDVGLPWAPDGANCAVDLSEEVALVGRRKLLVALPNEGKLVVLDAQEILDREIGSYGPCHIEYELALDAGVPDSLAQALPSDLTPGESAGTFVYDRLGGDYTARPAGMDERDGLVMVADLASPIVHRIDVADACHPAELEPFYATSLLEPQRVVTTSRVSISPKTQSGSQFAYVVDEIGNELSSVIIFDLSDGAGGNTPLVRPDSPFSPLEAPDRIEFSASVKDVTFAYIDRPITSPSIGVAATGTVCDPDPAATGKSIAAEYRPTGDDRGADPDVRRGLFAYILLGNGSIAIVDIEDFDAPCRRPVSVNRSDEPDFRGCFSDELDGKYFTSDGRKGSTPTVTDEVSCRVVVPHRARSQDLIETNETEGVNAPSLRAFGRLSQRGRGMATSRLTAEGRKNPILLGVEFAAPTDSPAVLAQVYVGNRLWIEGDSSDPLVIDPNEAEKASLVLPFIAPRAYPAEEVVSIIYEGTLDRTHITGLLDDPVGKEEKAEARFEDPNNSFCAQGVQDAAATEEVGQREFGLSGGALERFVDRHTDYVQLANLLFKEEDPYWKDGGAVCGKDSQFVDDSGYVLCDSVFGSGDTDELVPARDLSVIRAYRDHLDLAPRVKRGRTAEEHLALVNCCFPQTLEYRIRGGNQWVVKGTVTGLEHAIVPEDGDFDGACVRDGSPIKSRLRARAFEVSSTSCKQRDPEEPDACGVGLRTVDDVVCAYDASAGALRVGKVASECIFEGNTRRFVVYRGLNPTERDMAFGFEVIGGFRGDSIPLNFGSEVNILPVSIEAVPTFGSLSVVDSQNRGLLMIDVANSNLAGSFY